MVCLDFGTWALNGRTGPPPVECRLGEGDSCNFCGANTDGEPLLYTSSGLDIYSDIEFAVCQNRTKATFKALRVSQRRVRNGTLCECIMMQAAVSACTAGSHLCLHWSSMSSHHRGRF